MAKKGRRKKVAAKKTATPPKVKLSVKDKRTLTALNGVADHLVVLHTPSDTHDSLGRPREGHEHLGALGGSDHAPSTADEPAGVGEGA